MEPQKDIQQGQQKSTQPLGYAYVVRKAEKLTTALYLVTDILRDMEPLKWKAREASIDVLSDISVATTSSQSEKISTLRLVIKKIERIMSFLDIAASSHMMTEMNASVLKREYAALKEGVEAEWHRAQERSKVLLSERFFDVPKDAPEREEQESIKGVSSSAARIDAPSIPEPRPTYTPPTPKPFVPSIPASMEGTDTESTKGVSPFLRGESSDTSRSSSLVPRTFSHPPRPILIDKEVVARPRQDDSRDDRRKIILALLKQKPAVTVGDIAKSISGVSEKTIQRELLAMVMENILLKRGERRWSTYSIKID